MAEDLDDLLAVHHLLHEALGLGDGHLLLQEVAGGMAADVAGGEEHDDDAAGHHQGQPDAVIHHDAENAEQRDAGDGQLGQALADELAQGVDIIGVETHDIAVVVGIEVADGQILHVVKHLFPEFGQGALGDDGHELGIEDTRDQADDVHGDEDGQQLEDGAGGRGPVAGLVVCLHDGDDVLHEHRRHRADDGVDEDAGQGDRHQHRIKGKQGTDQAEHDALGGALAASGGVIRHPCHLPLCSGSHRFHDRPGWSSSARRGCRCRQCGRPT